MQLDDRKIIKAETFIPEKSEPTDAKVRVRPLPDGTCPISVSVLSSCEVNNLGVFSHCSHGNYG